MNGISSLAVSHVTAKIATSYPDLEATPRDADLRVYAPTIVGIGSECELYRKPTGVAGQPLPLHCH